MNLDYNINKRVGTRAKIVSKQDLFTHALNFAGITYKAVGKQKFKNSEHKGYQILRNSEVIGYSDSLENISNLLVIEGYYRELTTVNTGMKLQFIGGLEILTNFRRNFDFVTLQQFTKCEFRETKALKAGDIKGRKRKKASWLS